MTCKSFLRLVLTLSTILLPLTGPMPLWAGDGTNAPAGSVQLSSALTAHYEYHFNRNALRDIRRAGDAIIALTDSGNLLRFDLASLALMREWYGPSAVSCLGRGSNGTVLAGFEDGRICRLDPETLQPSELARLAGTPQWIEERIAEPARGTGPKILAVVEKSKWVEREGYRGPVPCSIIQDMASGKTVSLEQRATAFQQDSKGRLWLGADNGEWGGWCSVFDPSTGTLRSISGRKIFEHDPDKEYWLGVFGFFECHDGQVWAHGGTTHMGSTNGYVWRVDQGRAEELYFLDNEPPKQKERRKKEIAEAKAREAKEKAARPPRKGKFDFVIASGKLAPSNLPALDRRVSRLCRDGLGRLWIGGESLMMLDADSKTLHTFDTLPMLGRTSIDALAADPSHPEGIVAAMGTRGLIFVQARRSP